MRLAVFIVGREESSLYSLHVEVAEIMYSLKDPTITISKDKGCPST